MPHQTDTPLGGTSYDVFISYASGDFTSAAALHERLVAAGFRVWFDRRRLDPGCDWQNEIEAGCEAARIILPVITPLWQRSAWTKFETYASDKIIPLLVEGRAEDVLPPPLRRWNAVPIDPLATTDGVWETLFSAIRTKLHEPEAVRAVRIIDLPYPANPFFTGRDTDLVRIHEGLHEAPVAALTQGKVSALSAMGGVGKTTLANEYARRFWRLYQQILWVDARVGLEGGFALLFGKLFPGQTAEDVKQEQKARAVLVELSNTQSRLLVIDNVEDAETVRPWLPSTSTTGCRTLITSRFSDFSAAAGIRLISLDVLDPASARQFLLARTGQKPDGTELAACDDLAKVLGYLPLALEQAAAYLAAPGACVGFVDYLRLYEAAAADLLSRKSLGSTEYPDAVITTWQTTIKKLSSESRAVLRLCAWYADTPIPRVLVQRGAAAVMTLAESFGQVRPLSGAVEAELRMNDALVGLARYSMILDANNVSFRIHGLVQTVERVQAVAEGGEMAARRTALDLLKDVFPGDVFDNLGSWPLARSLDAIAAPIIRDAASLPAECDEAVATILERLALYRERALGAYSEAKPLFERAILLRAKIHGAESIEVARTVSQFGFVLSELGEYSRAKDLLERSVAILERNNGINDADTAEALHNLALLLYILEDYSSARASVERAISMFDSIHGPEHMLTLRSRHNLALILGAENDIDGARALFETIVEIEQRVLGPEHPDTGRTLDNLARILQRQGEVDAAIAMFRRAQSIYARELGPYHPHVAVNLNSLGETLFSAGKVDEARPLLELALAIFQQTLGSDHKNTQSARANLVLALAGSSGFPIVATSAGAIRNRV